MVHIIKGVLELEGEEVRLVIKNVLGFTADNNKIYAGESIEKKRS